MRATHLLALAGLATTLTLVAAPAAPAKGPVELCGRNACVPLAEAGAFAPFVQPGTPRAWAAPDRFYLIRWGHGLLGYWVPAAGVLRLAQPPIAWRTPAPETASLLADAGRGLEPFPAPRSARVVVEGKSIWRATGFLRALYGGVALELRTRTAWVEVFVFGATSPWTDGLSSVWVSREGSLLRRGSRTYRIAPTLAERIRDSRP